MEPPITDWDDAYANAAHIEGADAFFASWPERAAAFRAGAPLVRMEDGRSDLFTVPEPQGLFVFVHGGYWQATDARTWSHLAGGAVAAGWSALVAGYALCPEATVAEIVAQASEAVTEAAKRVEGPIVLAGHSAGGHLVAMMNVAGVLRRAVHARVRHTVAISPVADLRPLVVTKLNDALRLDEASAARVSPALLRPLPGTRLTAWVGGDERPEFLRQARLLADMWRGLGAATALVVEEKRHHFDVVDGLEDAASPLMRHALHVSA